MKRLREKEKEKERDKQRRKEDKQDERHENIVIAEVDKIEKDLERVNVILINHLNVKKGKMLPF